MGVVARRQPGTGSRGYIVIFLFALLYQFPDSRAVPWVDLHAIASFLSLVAAVDDITLVILRKGLPEF